MITERDLDEAIAECHGVKNPNADVCLKLASFYTIRDHMQAQAQARPMPSYSYASEPEPRTEFAIVTQNGRVENFFETMDELMTTLKVMSPRLYDSVIGTFS